MDFYNNVAAIAAVLMFAKLVTHRTRKATKYGSERRLAVVHTIGVATSAGAIVVSLIATASGAFTGLELCAWGLLGMSGLILVFDVLAADWSYANQRQGKKYNVETEEEPNTRRSQ